MRNRNLIAGWILVFAILACNFPSGAQSLLATTAVQTATPSASPAPLASATPLATNTSLPSPTSTPSVPVVSAKDVAVNCRFGPGIAWEVVSVLLLGTTTEIAGKNSENTWWYIKDPLNPGSFCWVSMSVTDAAGNLATIPVVPLPSASVTEVTVDAEVEFAACGGPNPVSFSGTIKTNGPTTVTYRWEVTGDTTNTTSSETLEFGEAGTKSVPDPGAYKVDCGDYTITLHVTDPNNKSAQKNFSAQP